MWRFLVLVLIVFPWLNPFAPGPSPKVVPWLFTLSCFTAFICIVILNQSKLGSTNKRNPNLAHAHLQPIVLAWLVAGLLSAVIGLMQYFGSASTLSPWVNQSSLGEAFANLRQRNQFATLTNMALTALLWVAVQFMQPQAASAHLRFCLLLTAAVLLAVGNATSSSRTGLFQLLLLCGLFAMWGGLRSVTVRSLLVCAVLTYVLASIAMPYLLGFDLLSHGAFARLGKDEGCSSRFTLWSNVLHLISQKPLLGWGWGELDYAHFITLYSEPRFCDILDNAHNLPLHLAVELGVPAAVLICGGFAWWVVRQKPWAERDTTRQMAWAVMAVILLHSMLEYPLWYGPFQMAFGLCILMLWHRKQPMKTQTSPNNVSNWRLAHILRAQTVLSLIAFIAYAAWDYHRISQIYLEPESRSVAYRTDTLNKIRSSWLFADQVQFAELLITPLTTANAEWTLSSAKQLLHYSPEPRVVEKLIESAVLLGEDDDALAYLARYKAAFPKEHALWAEHNPSPL